MGHKKIRLRKKSYKAWRTSDYEGKPRPIYEPKEMHEVMRNYEAISRTESDWTGRSQ